MRHHLALRRETVGTDDRLTNRTGQQGVHPWATERLRRLMPARRGFCVRRPKLRATSRQKMRRLHLPVWLVLLAVTADALAQEDEPGGAPPSAAGPAAAAKSIAPPGIDYPALQALGGVTALYIDQTYETSDDLSTFYWVQGHASGYRLAVGGSLRLGAFQANLELPALLTRLSIDSLGSSPPIPADRQKSSFSLGDAVGGGSYAWQLPIDSVTALVGLGMRFRLPTHTMAYSFQLVGGNPYSFGFPYYFHLAPASLLLVSYGALSFTMNQGLLAMLAKNTTLLGLPLNIPNVFFWESHYALSLVPVDWLGLSFELINCIQLSHVGDQNFQDLNHLKAFYLDPALTFDLGSYRIALAGRFGLGKDTQRFGVITFSGSRALLVRVSYVF